MSPAYSEATHQRFLQRLAETGYTLESPYTTATQKVRVRCPRGHLRDILPSNMIYYDAACKICADWEALQTRPFKSAWTKEKALQKYSIKYHIPYQASKPSFTSRADACRVIKCEPSQRFLQTVIETQDLPWDVAILTPILIAMEKWKFTYYPTKTIGKHKQTMVAVLLYWWGQRVGLKYSQITICEWVKITAPTLKTWLRRFRPFFATLK